MPSVKTLAAGTPAAMESQTKGGRHKSQESVITRPKSMFEKAVLVTPARLKLCTVLEDLDRSEGGFHDIPEGLTAINTPDRGRSGLAVIYFLNSSMSTLYEVRVAAGNLVEYCHQPRIIFGQQEAPLEIGKKSPLHIHTSS